MPGMYGTCRYVLVLWGEMERMTDVDPTRNVDGTFKEGYKPKGSQPYAITKENAREYQRRSVIARIANQTQAARDALLREAQAACPPDYTIDTWEDAFGLFTGALVQGGLDEDQKLHARVAVFNAIAKATDAFPDKIPLSVKDGDQAISGSPEEVYNLLMQAKEAKERDE